jgi:hypothetical protein
LGLFFTGDYLLYVPSLSEEEKSFLNIPKLLMTSTNVNSKIFREEMELLKNLAQKNRLLFIREKKRSINFAWTWGLLSYSFEFLISLSFDKIFF